MASKIYRQGDPAAPSGAHFIRDEQEAAIQAMCSEPTKSILCGANMDTGKTLMAIEFMLRMGFKRAVFVGVKDTYRQIADRLEAQSDGEHKLMRMDAMKLGMANLQAMLDGKDGFFFVGAQFLRAKDWKHVEVANTDGTPRYVIDKATGEPTEKVQTEAVRTRIYEKMQKLDVIVIDEVQLFANRKGASRKTLVSIPAEWKLSMSGTPAGNRFENFWSITRYLWKNEIPASFYAWRNRWCSMETIYVTGGKSQERVVGEAMPGAFTDSLPCYIRIDGELEVPTPEIYEVDLHPEQRAIYEDLERDLMVWLQTPAGHTAALVTDIPIVLRSRLRAATLGTLSIDDETGELFFPDDTKSTKLHALRQIVDRPDWSGQPIAIYVDSKKFAKVVVKRMRAAGYAAVEWSGDKTSKERDEIKRAFLAGEIPFLVATIQSFSTGLDGFQMVCNRVIWLSESDNNSLNQQAIKRFYRTGRAEGFAHVKIMARDSYDLGIMSRKVQETLAMNASLATRAAA